MWRRMIAVTVAGALTMAGPVVPEAASAARPKPASTPTSTPKPRSDTRTIQKNGRSESIRRLVLPRSQLPTPPGAADRGGPSTAGYGMRSDFDGDGITDVVSAYVGVSPQGSAEQSVRILYSTGQASQNGYSAFGFGEFHRPLISLASGDFDHNDYSDLVVGLPYDTAEGAGRIWVLAGGPNGLGYTDDDITWFDQDSDPEIPGTREAGDEFGRSLSISDINDDGHHDLVVGSPGEAIGTLSRAGMIHVFRGGFDGLEAAGAVGLSQADDSVPGVAEANDEFGMSVSFGEVTGDENADIAVGSPGENGVGMVTLLKGSPFGGDPTGATTLVAPRTSTVTPHRYGETLMLADVVGDWLDEVVTGAPDAVVNGHGAAGAVGVARCPGGGLTSTGHTYWHQDSANVPGAAEDGDGFGSALALGYLLGEDWEPDLVIGAQHEAVGTSARAGAIVVLRGTATNGLTGTGSVFVDQNAAGVPDVAEAGDEMGSSFQIAHDGTGDTLVVGAVGEQFPITAGPGSGSLTWFRREGGELVAYGPTLTGPALAADGWSAYQLGLASVR